MGKKNKRKKNSELLEKICSGKDGKKLNPFELKINKEKHQVLGKKQKKLIGLPAITHKKSLQKRKNTLLQEYIHRNKRNVFSDKRLHIEGRKKAQVMHQRLVDSDLYQLRDDEELTHRGQSLSNIEKMEEPISDSDDEQLHASFVESAHFGGFLTEKKTEEPTKSHKDLIKEIIAESKRKKFEKQSEREAGIEMTEKLDSDWKEIQHLLSKGIRKKPEEDKSVISSYDMTVKQLMYEARGGASNPTKRAEEIAKEEQEKQIKLEMDRKGRMNMCFDDVPKNSEEKSVDFISASPVRPFVVSDDMNKDDNVISTSLPVGSITSDEISKNNNVISTSLHVGPFTADEMNTNNGKICPTSNDEPLNKSLCLDSNKPSNDESKIKNKIQIPTTLQKFIDITSKYSKEELHSFIGEIIINHRSELDNLGVFFNVIVEYACYIADNEETDITILDILIPRLYELAEMSPKVAAQYLLLTLKTAEQQFEDTLKIKKHKRFQYPKLSTLILLKMCCVLFPTSDFRHLVTSPAILFITRLLVECRVLTVRDVLCGLFTCNLSLECVSYSKRFLPEALNFLTGLLNLAACKDGINLVPSYSQFEDFKADFSLPERTIPPTVNKLKLSDLRNSNKEIDDMLKFQLINYSIELIVKFIDLYKELPSYLEIFSSLSSICERLCDMNYPEFLNDKINKVITLTKPSNHPKIYIAQPKRPLKCLRFIEPKIEENFDGRKVRKGNKQHLEKEKLKYKYKREMKGAVREIRHDNYFLANQWLNEQASKDKERKEKVKKLYQELANQEGDIRCMKRRKF